MPATRPVHSTTRSLRWLALLAASVLLHVLFFAWAGGHLSVSSRPEPELRAVEVALLAPPPLPPAAPPAPKPKPAAKPAPRPKPRPAPAPRPEPQVVQAPEPAPPADAVAEAPTEAAAAGPNAEADVNDGASASEAGAMPLETNEPEARERVELPPSARLHYKVVASKDKQPYYGNGVFVWESNAGRYKLSGKANATLLFIDITVLNFSSEGVVDEFGAAPVLYTEKPWRKATVNTHFQHEQGKISFSASTANYPYQGGEQDRASVLWQLAGLGRAAEERMQAGAVLEMVVAGTRDVKTWRIEVAGIEDVEGPEGTVQAWHLVRARPDGSYEQRIDIWLAPTLQWYPVKIRQTSVNGDYLELSLAEFEALSAPETTQPGTQ